MRSRHSALSALAFLLLAGPPARAGEVAGPRVRAASGARGMGGLTTAEQISFAQNLSRVIGSIGRLSVDAAPGAPTAGESAAPGARTVVSFLAGEIGRPAPAAQARANEAALAALWGSPRFAAALVKELETSGTPEASRAARDLSGLVQQQRAGIDAGRAALAAQIPELRTLSLPGSAAELFDGMRERRSDAEGPGASLVTAPGQASSRGLRPGWRLGRFDRSASPPLESLHKEVPSARLSAQKEESFLRGQVKFLGTYAVIAGLAASAFKGVTALGEGLIASGPPVSGAAQGAATMVGTPTVGILGWIASLPALPLLLLQMGVIIGVGKLFSSFLSRFGQPAVIGQIAGGLALGPSLFGLLLPALAAALFPPASLVSLQALSQVGLIAFMAMIGHEVDLKSLKNQSGAAGLISHASIFLPFVLGGALALFLFTGFAPAGVSFLSFSMFMGIAMSITAFPVLARILHERGLTGKPLGTLALACAAIDDVTGWALLALVLAVASGGSAVSIAYVLGLTVLQLAAMFGVVRPLLNGLASRFSGRKWYKPVSLAAYALIVALSAFSAEAIGIHALFGAFIAGAVIPREAAGGLSENLAKRIQGMSAAVLLPVFFALTGLRTQLDLLTSPALWGVALVVLALAVAGKLGGSALAARYSGLSWRESLSIGALMNTRGLMELVVLNIGYERGIISAPLFAIFVMMALITTMMTGPLLSLFDKPTAAERAAEATSRT